MKKPQPQNLRQFPVEHLAPGLVPLELSCTVLPIRLGIAQRARPQRRVCLPRDGRVLHKSWRRREAPGLLLDAGDFHVVLAHGALVARPTRPNNARPGMVRLLVHRGVAERQHADQEAQFSASPTFDGRPRGMTRMLVWLT